MMLLHLLAGAIAAGTRAVAPTRKPFQHSGDSHAGVWAPENSLRNRPDRPADAGGGGAFGRWGTDEYGLPVYRFTLDQTVEQATAQSYSSVVEDSAEAGETGQGPFHEDTTSAMFMIGNDELVLLLSTYGHAQVRQDEGGPKLLSDYQPADSQFGGGLGYLVDTDSGELLLTTRFVGSKAAPQQHYQREFGVGYTRRTLSTALEPDGVTPAGLVMEQRLVVPFGSDPVVVSQTVLTNNSPKPLSLSYYEVWGASAYQLAYGKGGHTSTGPDARRAFQRSNYSVSVKRMADLYGVSCEQTYTGTPGADTPPFSAPGATLWDEQPPLSFLVNAYEHDVTTDTGCSASAFFGTSKDGTHSDAAASKPAFGLRCDTDSADSSSGSDAALILRRNVSLAIGDTVEFAFLYGYVVPPLASRYDAGAGRATPTLKSLIARYSYGRTRGNEILVQNGELWRGDIPSVEIENYPWIGREVAWNYAMARQTLTFDSFFNEHILDQGTGYRYDMGFQGAARDPLQHALPFILTDPNVTKSIIRYTLKELHSPTTELGDKIWNIPYFVIGHGIVGPPDPTAVVGARPSDEELYLLYATTEYVLTTKDVDFLSERVRAYNSTLNRTVLRCLVDSYKYVTTNIGVGSHGILRMQTGDWNDVFVQEAMDGGSTRAEVVASGESSTNAAMAAAVLPRFAELIELAAEITGDYQYRNLTDGIRQFAESQAAALKAHAWNGKWLNRAWIPLPNNASAGGPGAKQFPHGWACTNGVDDRLCLEPQPWAIIASTQRSSSSSKLNGSDSAVVLDAAQIATLIDSMRSKLGSPLGSTVLSRPFARTAVPAKAEMSGGRGASSSRTGDAADSGQHENGGVWPRYVCRHLSPRSVAFSDTFCVLWCFPIGQPKSPTCASVGFSQRYRCA